MTRLWNERAGIFLAYDKNLDRLRKWAHASVRPDGNAKVGSPVGGHIQDGVR